MIALGQDLKMVNDAVKMRQGLTKSKFGIKELTRIYIATPVAHYIKQDAPLGGYVPNKKRLRQKSYFK